MKKLLTFAAATLLCMAACADYQSQIDTLKQQVAQLTEEYSASASNVSALERTVDAVKNGDPLESILPVNENGNVTGYELTFKEGGKVTLYNQSANVTVAEENGRYYWKADGRWLTDHEGNRIEVGGEEAPAPQFKTDGSRLEMSVDGGKTWKAMASWQKPIVAGISETSEGVTVMLADGSTISIPRAKEYEVTFNAAPVSAYDGETVESTYTLSGAPAGTKVRAIGNSGWTAVIVSETENGGTVRITAPAGAVDTDIILTASDNEGRAYLAGLHCTASGKKPVDPTEDPDPEDPDNPDNPDNPEDPDVPDVPDVPEAQKFEIFAYSSIPTPYATHENFVKMAEAGFTISQSNFSKDAYEGATVLENVIKALDAAQGTGVKLCIPLTEWFDPALKAVIKPEKTVEEVVGAIKDHPALWGYLIGDEPGADELDTYGSYIEAYQKLDPDHPWYTCFLPVSTFTNTSTHAEYVDAVTDHFLKHPTQFLAFDMYPVRTGNTVASWWYECLENYCEYTQQKNIPLAGMACSVEFDGQAFPSVEALRLQNYTNLAYGCQALMYFTYMVPYYKTDGWVDGSAPMKLDGTHSEVYDMVKQVNAELNNQAFVFLGSKVQWVRNARTVPSHTTKLSSSNYYDLNIDYLSFSTHTVVSLLENGQDRYLVMVNQNLSKNDVVEIEFGKGLNAQIVEKDGSFVPARDVITEDDAYLLAPGDALILKLN